MEHNVTRLQRPYQVLINNRYDDKLNNLAILR